MEILETTILGNLIEDWLIGIGVAVAVFIGLRVSVGWVKRRVSALAARTDTQVDDLVAAVLNGTKTAFLLVLAAFAGSLMLTLPAETRGTVVNATVIALMVQGGIWSSRALTFLLKRYAEREVGQDAASVATVNALGFVGRLVLWSVVLLLALDNAGVNVTALVTGLGIGGIAVALAVQNVLGDLFASLAIVFDRPFVIGDFLVVGDLMGTVERVGLKTTRIRSLSGEQLVFANTDLLGSRIRNYGRMYERRVLFSVGVAYQTPRANIELIPAILRSAIEAQEKTRFDRAHFKAFGSYSLDFEAVYYVLDPAYNVYMDIQQAINLWVHERFEKEGIQFAFPSQTLYLVEEATAPESA